MNKKKIAEVFNRTERITTRVQKKMYKQIEREAKEYCVSKACVVRTALAFFFRERMRGNFKLNR